MTREEFISRLKALLVMESEARSMSCSDDFGCDHCDALDAATDAFHSLVESVEPSDLLFFIDPASAADIAAAMEQVMRRNEE